MLKKFLLTMSTVTLLFVGNASACPNHLNVGGSAQNYLVPKVVNAVSKTGLTALQTKKISEGIAEYRNAMGKIKKMQIFPIDSFMNDEFNEKRFIQEMAEKDMAKIAAKAALFKFVFAVLNTDQRKAFKNAYAAPMIEKMIRMNY